MKSKTKQNKKLSFLSGHSYGVVPAFHNGQAFFESITVSILIRLKYPTEKLQRETKKIKGRRNDVVHRWPDTDAICTSRRPAV